MFLPSIYDTAFIYFNSYDTTALHNCIKGHVEGTNGTKLRSTNLIKVMTGSVKVFCFSLRQGLISFENYNVKILPKETKLVVKILKKKNTKSD